MNPRSQHEVSRRSSRARGVVILMIGVLAVAFFRVQVLRSERYQVLSESNRLRTVALPAPRGLIVDRHGLVIAENVPGYAVALNASTDNTGTCPAGATCQDSNPGEGILPGAPEREARKRRGPPP